MTDYTDNALLSSIKALEHVVQPALDPADPLAGEQLRLVTGMLKFLRTRLPDLYPRLVFELDHYLALAEQLVPEARLASREVAQRMEEAIEKARSLKQERAPAFVETREATAALSLAISGLARIAGRADANLRHRIEHAVLAGSRRWVDMQRAWYVPHGFELRTEQLPDLSSVLASRAPNQRTGG